MTRTPMKWESEHGRTWNKNEPNSRTVCKCGKEFSDDRGYYVHLGKMIKMSKIVQSLVKRKQE